MGPVVSKEHKEKIEKYLELARQNGHEVITGGEMDESTKRAKKGYYIMPTVVLNVDDRSKLMTEEIFGPVVCIVPFDTEEEVEKQHDDSLRENPLFSPEGHRTSKSESVWSVWLCVDGESQSSSPHGRSHGSRMRERNSYDANHDIVLVRHSLDELLDAARSSNALWWHQRQWHGTRRLSVFGRSFHRDQNHRYVHFISESRTNSTFVSDD